MPLGTGSVLSTDFCWKEEWHRPQVNCAGQTEEGDWQLFHYSLWETREGGWSGYISAKWYQNWRGMRNACPLRNHPRFQQIGLKVPILWALEQGAPQGGKSPSLERRGKNWLDSWLFCFYCLWVIWGRAGVAIFQPKATKISGEWRLLVYWRPSKFQVNWTKVLKQSASTHSTFLGGRGPTTTKEGVKENGSSLQFVSKGDWLRVLCSPPFQGSDWEKCHCPRKSVE